MYWSRLSGQWVLVSSPGHSPYLSVTTPVLLPYHFLLSVYLAVPDTCSSPPQLLSLPVHSPCSFVTTPVFHLLLQPLFMSTLLSLYLSRPPSPLASPVHSPCSPITFIPLPHSLPSCYCTYLPFPFSPLLSALSPPFLTPSSSLPCCYCIPAPPLHSCPLLVYAFLTSPFSFPLTISTCHHIPSLPSLISLSASWSTYHHYLSLTCFVSPCSPVITPVVLFPLTFLSTCHNALSGSSSSPLTFYPSPLPFSYLFRLSLFTFHHTCCSPLSIILPVYLLPYLFWHSLFPSPCLLITTILSLPVSSLLVHLSSHLLFSSLYLSSCLPVTLPYLSLPPRLSVSLSPLPFPPYLVYPSSHLPFSSLYPFICQPVTSPSLALPFLTSSTCLSPSTSPFLASILYFLLVSCLVPSLSTCPLTCSLPPSVLYLPHSSYHHTCPALPFYFIYPFLPP